MVLTLLDLRSRVLDLISSAVGNPESPMRALYAELLEGVLPLALGIL